MSVRWGGTIYDVSMIANGVRQGGIMYPFICNVYMDDLSVNLNKCPTGRAGKSTELMYLSKSTSNSEKSYSSTSKSTRKKLYLKYK